VLGHRVMAPSTLDTILRAFSFGHVRQFEAVVASELSGLAIDKRLRYCLLHTPVAITRSGRRTRLRLSAAWPWAGQLCQAFARVGVLQLLTT
jgi:hypothetical protein